MAVDVKKFKTTESVGEGSSSGWVSGATCLIAALVLALSAGARVRHRHPLPVVLATRLDENSRELAEVHHHVVGPFHLHARDAIRSQRPRNGKPDGKRKPAKMPGPALEAPQQRKRERPPERDLLRARRGNRDGGPYFRGA